MKRFICMMLTAVMLICMAAPACAEGAKGYLLGDADMDNNVTILDATRIQRVIADLDSLSEIGTRIADVDRDELVTIIDATRIQRYVAELCNLDGTAPYDPERPTTYIQDDTAVTSIMLNASELSLYPGETFGLAYTLNEGAAASVIWSVDDKRIASVSNDGLVYAKSQGTAVVTAKTDNGLTASCKVTIRDKQTSLTLPIRRVNIPVNGTFKLKAYPGNAAYSGKYVWTSTEPDIAVVSASGLNATVTAKKSGKATVTVTAESGAKASCTIIVTKTKTSDSLEKQINSMPLYPIRTGIVALDNKVDAIFSKIFKSGYTTYDKLKAVYDYEIANFSYAYTDLTDAQEKVFSDNPDNRDLASYEDWLLAHRAYETLVTGEGVCYNYAAVFTVMMRAIGLECFSIDGTSTYADGHWGVHTWNNILINGRFLLFDAQVDDNIHNNLGYTLYDRFGLTDSESTTDYKYTNSNRLDDARLFRYFAEQKAFTVAVTISGGGRTWSQNYTFPADRYYSSITLDTGGHDGPFDYSIRVTSGGGEYKMYGDPENYDSEHTYYINRFEGSFEDRYYSWLELLDVTSGRELDIYLE